jgi:hypothetical protein
MIDLEQFPPEMREQVKKDIEEKGEWMVSQSIYLAPLWRMIHDLEETDTDICWLATTLHMINFFSTKDPSPIHFTIAREELKKNGIDDDKAIDNLARDLVTYCQKLQQTVLKAFSNKEDSWCVLPMSTDNSYLIPDKTSLPGLICQQDGCNSIDLIFSEFIETIGATGKKAAEEIRKDSRQRHQAFKDSEYRPENRPKAWDLWISKKSDFTSIFSPYLSILAAVVWKDSGSIKWERKQKYFPALPTGIMETIKPSLQKSSNINYTHESIDIVGESGKVVVSFQIPCIDAKIIPLVTKGIKSFGSLAGHRLLRWQVKSGCQNIIDNTPSPNTLFVNGGFEAISHLIGCGENKSTVTEVKAILYAQSHASFYLSNGDKISSLIILKEIGYHRNGEPNKLSIILGDVLLPHYLYNLPQNERRLIPIMTDLPPLVGSPNTHAAQAMLQLLVLEEFSKQSDRYADKGSVLIPVEKWEELSQNASLSKSSISKVIEGWTTDSVNGTAFLKRYDDEYTLSDARVEKFLEDQGKMRIIGRKGGISSSEKASEKKLKILGS